MDRSVTAIIATYNRAGYLADAIESLLAQQEPLAQLIVVDDGSTDRTAEVAGAFGSRILFLRKGNGGKSTAINLALGHATSEWIWIFDDDDLAFPNATRDLLDALEARPSADFAFGGQVIAHEAADGTLTGHRAVPPAVEPGPGFLLDVLMGFSFRLQSTLIRRRCFAVVGLLDERFLRGQDYELITRLARRFSAARIDAPMLVWRQHAGERGPSNARHGADERDRLWARFDALLGNDLRQSYSLGEFLVPPRAEGPASLSEDERASALFNRAVIMGTKGLLGEFVEDLDSSFGARPSDGGLSGFQTALLHRLGSNARFQAALSDASPTSAWLGALPRGRSARATASALGLALKRELRSGTASTHSRGLQEWAARLLAYAGPAVVARELLARASGRARRLASRLT